MYFLALAADYDGTIAHHGSVSAETCEALRRLKGSGRRLLLVTGRGLADLRMLAEMDLSPHNVVAVGDAENDHAFLHMCGCAAAVANALPAIKEEVDITLSGDHGGMRREAPNGRGHLFD